MQQAEISQEQINIVQSTWTFLTAAGSQAEVCLRDAVLVDIRCSHVRVTKRRSGVSQLQRCSRVCAWRTAAEQCYLSNAS